MWLLWSEDEAGQEQPQRTGMCVRLLKRGAQRERAFRVHGWEPNACHCEWSSCTTQDVTAGQVAGVQILRGQSTTRTACENPRHFSEAKPHPPAPPKSQAPPTATVRPGAGQVPE